jgi:X-X-X-Leu-X-X-Gly heptad repeat protein
VSVKQNTKVSKTFYDNYALQIALSLDNKLCSDIKTENATIAEAGSKKQLSYTVLPGNGIDIIVTSDVHDFEMDPITINGIKLALGITVDSNEFTGQISELTDAIKELDNGAVELLNGLNQLSSGMQKYIDGMKAFKDGLGQLSAGADKLNTGATALKNGLTELTKQNASLVNGALTIQQATFDSVNAQLGGMGLGLPVLTPENYSTVLSPIPDLVTLKKQLDGTVQFTQGLKGYTGGVAQLGKGASDLASGTSDFKSSSSIIASSANELYKAGAELNTGIKKLRDGLTSYKNGTKQLRDGTSGMNSEIDNKIDDMLGSISGKGDKVISFVSDKNTNVSAVQFVLKTDSINIPEVPKAVDQKPVELNFWQKLLKLFGLYNP